MGSSFGQLFRITTWGESHGGGVGVVIDGCPPRLELSEEDIQRELDRRRPGQSEIVTPRAEADRCRILSGVFEGRTLGTPISILVKNKDAQAGSVLGDESRLPAVARRLHLRSEVRRPKLAGRRTRLRARNGWAGRRRRRARKRFWANSRRAASKSSPTWRKFMKSWRESIEAPSGRRAVERNAVRCPDEAAAELMTALIQSVRAEGDSVGGVIECVIRGLDAGSGRASVR